jgi:hypothetical protein
MGDLACSRRVQDARGAASRADRADRPRSAERVGFLACAIAVAGKTTTFAIPSGKLVWRPAACQLSEESERRAPIELGPGDVARIECEESNREGMCCEQKSIEKAPSKN